MHQSNQPSVWSNGVNSTQENIALCKKLLADHNITDGQRDVIGKMLAEEKVKLLKLHSPQEQ